MRKTVESVSGQCCCAEIDVRSSRAEFASASAGVTRRGNDTTSASGANFAKGRALFAAKVSKPFKGRSVQSVHWCLAGCAASPASECDSSQHVCASPQDFSISKPPSPQRHSTIPSTPAEADATNMTNANKYTVQAFTYTIIARTSSRCQEGTKREKCEYLRGAKVDPGKRAPVAS